MPSLTRRPQAFYVSGCPSATDAAFTANNRPSLVFARPTGKGITRRASSPSPYVPMPEGSGFAATFGKSPQTLVGVPLRARSSLPEHNQMGQNPFSDICPRPTTVYSLGSVANWPGILQECAIVGEPAVNSDRRRTIEPGEESQFLHVIGESVRRIEDGRSQCSA